jgi:hypothetical protein
LPRKKGSHVEGGTAVQPARSFPIVAIAAALALTAGIIAFFALRKDNAPQPQPAATQAQDDTTADDTAQAAEQPEASAQPAGPDVQSVAADLEKTLKRERLWATVSIVGDHVDVRSGSCSDEKMAPLLDGAAASFKAAGLTRIRCLEQSGRVVTDRDL